MSRDLYPRWDKSASRNRISDRGASSDVTGTATPVFYDANGNKLNDLQDKVKVLGGDITYTMQILKVKTIPLDFVVTGEVAQGYKYTGVETSVKNVSVAGLKSDLAGISTLTVRIRC